MNKLIRHEFRENISLFINIILVIVVTLEILYLGVGIIFSHIGGIFDKSLYREYEFCYVNSADNFEHIYEVLGGEKITDTSGIGSEFYGIWAELIFDQDHKLYEEKDMNFSLIQGRFFSDEEIINGKNVIMLSNKYLYEHNLDYKVNDYIRIRNTDYKIVGIYKSVSARIAIPYNTVRNKDGLEFGSIYINVNEKITKTEKKQLISDIPDIQIEIANKGEINYQIIYSLIYAGMVVVVDILCVCNLIHLMKVYNQNNRRKFEIYKSLGASQKTLRTIKYAFLTSGIIISVMISIPVYIVGNGVLDAII